MNALEERQRSLLTQAIGRRDDAQRDRLQRELVIMNDKLALLADSYAEEVACCQQVLETLEQLRGEVEEQTDLERAINQLQNGETQAAEDFLAGLSEQPRLFAAQAAYGGGLLAECRVDLQKALALYRQAVEQEPDNPRYLQAAGRAARSLYNYKVALPWLESFVRLARTSDAYDPQALALAQRELAYTYVLSGQYQKAGPLYKESMTVLARELGEDHPEMATSWRQIGELQETLGEYDKAVSLYKKALAILEKKRGPEHPVLANILAKLAALCMELEMEKEAVPLYERLVRIQEKALRPTHPQLAISLNSLAESYRLQGRYADAFACYQKSLGINETLHGPEHPSVAAILQELAKLCISQRQPEEATHYQQRAAAIFQKSVEASEKKSGQEALTLEL
jgi:tetratricopeptide (TPR) repeat protein